MNADKFCKNIKLNVGSLIGVLGEKNVDDNSINQFVKEFQSNFQNQISISRDYFDLQGEPTTLKTMVSGDLILVRITASAARNLPDALVVDLLPAGLEIENQNLADASIDMSKLSVDGVSVADWQQRQQVEHVEYRDDRFVAALRLDEYQSRQLFYLARAVTPGEYSVPAPYAEDMYRPFYHALGASPEKLVITP